MLSKRPVGMKNLLPLALLLSSLWSSSSAMEQQDVLPEAHTDLQKHMWLHRQGSQQEQLPSQWDEIYEMTAPGMGRTKPRTQHNSRWAWEGWHTTLDRSRRPGRHRQGERAPQQWRIKEVVSPNAHPVPDTECIDKCTSTKGQSETLHDMSRMHDMRATSELKTAVVTRTKHNELGTTITDDRFSTPCKEQESPTVHSQATTGPMQQNDLRPKWIPPPPSKPPPNPPNQPNRNSSHSQWLTGVVPHARQDQSRSHYRTNRR